MSMVLDWFGEAAGGPSPIANPSTLAARWSHPSIALSNGNLTATHDGTTAYHHACSFDAKASGKWYFEVTVDSLGGGAGMAVGVCSYAAALDFSTTPVEAFSMADDGKLYRENEGFGISFETAWSAADVISVAYDADARSIRVRKNGGSWSSPYTMSGTNPLMPMVQLNRPSSALTVNFGGTAFTYPTPAGHNAWELNANYAGRYWRCRMMVTGGSHTDGYTIAETTHRLTSGGSNQISGGTASASSSFSGTYDASKAIDGSASTFWSSNGAGAQYWQYDYGSGVTKAIKEITQSIRNDSYSQYPSRLSYVYSLNGTDWFPARMAWSLSWTNGEIKTFAVADG